MYLVCFFFPLSSIDDLFLMILEDSCPDSYDAL
jgi:hypothetical protein